MPRLIGKVKAGSFDREVNNPISARYAKRIVLDSKLFQRDLGEEEWHAALNLFFRIVPQEACLHDSETP